jgi:soluble lytic murein transglycosylase
MIPEIMHENVSYFRGCMKRFLFVMIFMGFLISSCSPGSSTDSWLDNLSSPKVSPTPTATATPLPKARISIGEDDILSGDYDAALNEYWTAREQSTDPEIIAAAQLGVGRVLLLQSDYSGAITQLNWLLANVPQGETRSTGYFYLAQAYLGMEQYLLAADAFGNFLQAQSGPLDSEILEMQGDAYTKAEDYPKALACYQAARQKRNTGNTDSLDIKIAQSILATGDYGSAINALLALFDSTSNNLTKASANLLLGQIYLRLNESEQAYARFQDSVTNFPVYYDTYSGLVALVEAGQPVNELMRGIVDYYAGKYGLAIEAFDRYLYSNPDHDATIHYYKALSLWNLGDYEGEVAEWDILIRDHPKDEKYATAFLEKATTLYNNLQRYEEAAQSLLDFVALIPDSSSTPDYLFRAARIYELGGYLTKAAATWERIINEYPSSDQAYQGLFQAGIIYYRLAAYQQAQVTFQRLVILALTPEETASAKLWVGKCLEKQGKPTEALDYYSQASKADPTGYYGIRATELLNGQSPFPRGANIDLSVDLEADRKIADQWMINIFNLDPSINLTDVSALQVNQKFLRGQEYTKLGMRDEARAEFDALRGELISDPVNTYRLLGYLIDHKFYYTAVYTSRQVLDQAGLSQEQTLTNAPKYFNHIRFGVFFRDIVVSAANENSFDPLLLFSIIRQESLFEPLISSSADARGLMQILPEVGQEIANNFGWPPEFKTSDLDRPVINVRLGANYLKKWSNYFDGDLSAALSSYNAGIGATIPWQELSNGDVDLFVEMIRYEQTREYIRFIAENYEIYKSIYTHP